MARDSNGSDLGFEVLRSGASTALRSAFVDSLLFNRVFVHAAEVSEGEMQAWLRDYRVAGIQRFLIHVAPAAYSLDLVRRLEARKIEAFTRDWVKFLRRAGPTPRVHTDLTIRRAEPRDVDRAGHVLAFGLDVPEAGARAFSSLVGVPGWHVFVACDETTQVAAATLFVHDGIGYLAGAATLPSHRRRGAQAALLRARMQVAVDTGCEFVTSETGELRPGKANVSYRNLLRAGLEPVYVRKNFAPAGVTWTKP